VRLLIDANLSPRIALRLRDEGHEAVHVADFGMLAASDDAILAYAAASGQVIVTADTDIGELLAVSGASRPSVVLLRSADHLTPDQQATMLAANLPTVADELEKGASSRWHAAGSVSVHCPNTVTEAHSAHRGQRCRIPGLAPRARKGADAGQVSP
jgi:predicted nuclease of predicted toxin-antitoxin system